MSPLAAWGAILIARIWPRPSAVAWPIPPPAEHVTVCCASWDWISESRHCICCPSWSRLDKSAMCRKLPLPFQSGKLLQQLEVERVHGGVETGIAGAQLREPLSPRRVLGEPDGARPGRRAARRTGERDARRHRQISSDQLHQRVALALDALRVDSVVLKQPDGDGCPLDRCHFGRREERAEQLTLRARVGDHARPQGAEAIERQRTLFGDGGRGTGDGWGPRTGRRIAQLDGGSRGATSTTRPPSPPPPPPPQCPYDLFPPHPAAPHPPAEHPHLPGEA